MDEEVLIEFRAGAAQVLVVGPSGKRYGFHSGGERFKISRADAEAWPQTFARVLPPVPLRGYAPSSFAVAPRQRVRAQPKPPAEKPPPVEEGPKLIEVPDPLRMSKKAIDAWLAETLEVIEAKQDFEALQTLYNRELEGKNRKAVKAAIEKAGQELGFWVGLHEPAEEKA